MDAFNSTNTVKAAVIIPTKNPGAIFRRVLPMVCAQKTAFPFDVLVIDSGSKDGTVEYVRSYPDERVRLHEIAPAEFGHGKTRNLGVSLTSGEFAVLITHDALPADEHWLQAMVTAAEADPQIAGVFGRHLAYPDASPYTKRDLERHFVNFTVEPVVWIQDRAQYDSDAGLRQRLHFFSDNNALIRRSVWERLPYPDVDFAEDQIWAEEALKAGWKKAYAHDGVVYHSHDFENIEKLQRSFDESYALYRLFGYVLTPNLKHMVLSWLAQTRNDWRYARATGMWRSHFGLTLNTPVHNLMRSVGHYLGSRAERLPQRLRHWMSRDRRMLRGLPTSKKNRPQ